jgi:hypothetical protein
MNRSTENRTGFLGTYFDRDAALRMLSALCEPAYLASQTDGWEGILKEQIYHLHKDLGVGESCMFGDYFFVEALEYGTPPHGGIALGLDRLTAILAGESSIRDVIAFPKTAAASDLMAGAPIEVDQRQLDELHLRLAR